MLRRACASASITLAFLVAIEASAQPQRTFVASYGNDVWPCSLAQPCRGFQVAINAVAPGGEVVALDSAGYGTMEIHKSVSVIVPTGIHAGLSPTSGIPLPGYPGQYGVVLIDIADADVVVLRGLNINHQGTVTGGIEWISTSGGTVYVESVVVNGFPKEGVYMQSPLGTLFLKDSILRNNGVGVYGAGLPVPGVVAGNIYGDHLHIEKSNTGIRVTNGVQAKLSNCTITANGTAFDLQSFSLGDNVLVSKSTVSANLNVYNLNTGLGKIAGLFFAASTIASNASAGTRTGTTFVGSFGNNSNDQLGFDGAYPPQ